MNNQTTNNYVQEDGQQPVVKTNTLCIVAFVLAILMGPIGAIFGFIGLSQVKKSGEKGKGLAIAAIVIGLLGIVLVAVIGFVFTAFVWPTIQTDLLLSTGCANVDNNGNYQNVYIQEQEEGDVVCKNYICTVTYNNKEYTKNCSVE